MERGATQDTLIARPPGERERRAQPSTEKNGEREQPVIIDHYDTDEIIQQKREHGNSGNRRLVSFQELVENKEDKKRGMRIQYSDRDQNLVRG